MIHPKLILALKAAASLLLMLLLFSRLDAHCVVAAISEMPPYFFGLVVVGNLFVFFLAAVKWWILLPRYRLRVLFSLTLVGHFYSMVLPGQVAGEVLKLYKLSRATGDTERIAASVFVDKLTGFVALLMITVLGLLLSAHGISRSFLPWVTTLALFFGVGLVICRVPWLMPHEKPSRKLLERIREVILAWRSYTSRPKTILGSIALGSVFQFSASFIVFSLAILLGLDVRFWDIAWVFGVVSVALFIPITIGGVGVREGGFVLLLGKMGIAQSKAMALALAVLGVQVICAVVGAAADNLISVEKTHVDG